MASSRRAGGQNETVLDGLKALYGDVANLALCSDAGQYGQVIDGLRQGVLKAVEMITQQKAQQAAQMQMQQRQAAINPQMGGMQPGMGGGMPGGPAGPPHPGMPGGPPSQGSPGIAMPNPDELRRVLAAQGQGG